MSFMASSLPQSTPASGPWSPLSQPVFRRLWLAVLASNIGTWIHDVSAAWVIAETTGSPFMVAAVQAATTLPVVLLALLAGTLADIVDRRKYLILAQLWMLMVAATLALLAHLQMLAPWTLIALTFALGIGAAMAMPAQQATTPELVPRTMLSPAVTTIGIIGAGEIGSQVARAAVANGYDVVIANSRGPETLRGLVDELGPSARASTAAGAAAAGDFVVVAVPLKEVNDMPAAELAGKVVLDTNNYMIWRDGHFPIIDSGVKTVHELRQEHLPTSKVVQAFTHIRAPRITTAGKPPGSPGRLALPTSSDFPEAVELVTRLYDQFGFDTVDNSPLSESWRSAPRQPAWIALEHQTRTELMANLARARRIVLK
jgi:8-hydroxy-5-deazaflavin:NADPH oxidoreductase